MTTQKEKEEFPWRINRVHELDLENDNENDFFEDFAMVPIYQAHSLYKAAKMILVMHNNYLDTDPPGFMDSQLYDDHHGGEYDEAISLLRKGIEK